MPGPVAGAGARAAGGLHRSRRGRQGNSLALLSTLDPPDEIKLHLHWVVSSISMPVPAVHVSLTDSSISESAAGGEHASLTENSDPSAVHEPTSLRAHVMEDG